jgi:hypothetical protein
MRRNTVAATMYHEEDADLSIIQVARSRLSVTAHKDMHTLLACVIVVSMFALDLRKAHHLAQRQRLKAFAL